VVPLTDAERLFLQQGQGAPYAIADKLAVAHLAGYADVEAMVAGWARINRALKADEPLTGYDWRRALVMAEITFASDLHGVGVEWETVTGGNDLDDLVTLRRLQRKLAAVIRGGSESSNDRWGIVDAGPSGIADQLPSIDPS